MSVETTLFNRLSTFGGLTALIGTAPVRLFPVIMPEGTTKPAVTYQRIYSDRTSCMVDDDGIVWARIQFTAWAETFVGAQAVKEQLRQALQRWSTSGVQDIFIVGDYDLYDEAAYLHGAAIDAQVVYEEVV